MNSWLSIANIIAAVNPGEVAYCSQDSTHLILLEIKKFGVFYSFQGTDAKSIQAEWHPRWTSHQECK